MKEFILKNKTALLFITLVFISAITGLFLLNFKNIPEEKSELTNLEEVTKNFVEKEINLNQNPAASPKKIEKINASSNITSTSYSNSDLNSKNVANFTETKITSSEPTDPLEPTENKNYFPVKLQINAEEYSTSLGNNSTAYEAMQKISVENPSFTFSGKLYNSLGFFVESINGIKNDYRNGQYWIFYVNGTKSKTGISGYIINPNDILSWKYEKSI